MKIYNNSAVDYVVIDSSGEQIITFRDSERQEAFDYVAWFNDESSIYRPDNAPAHVEVRYTITRTEQFAIKEQP